jgi:uncharacterized protein YbjQ (UPF0145 family)
MANSLQPSRRDVVTRMVEEAQARGGNAVAALPYDPSELGGSGSETCAYGTAVVIEPTG